jgi:glycosyltransferase involved in cell wall biosynthesis
MDICVCGAQVPFMRGGAELLTENLVAALRDAGHRAELVRLPTAWDSARIFDAALAWRLVPMDADLVIATNFPSYFVRHPRKVVWLLHQHRAAYDGAGTPWSDFDLRVEALEAQRLLTEWDDRALAEATKLYAASRVVADRLARFNGIAVEPLYHPAPLHAELLALEPEATGDTVFSATRLERNKRPELLVEAAARLESGARVVVAGRGTLAEELHDLVRERNLGSRVSLPGFVPDADLVRHFAAARVVVYTPQDEDYGYVTLQAFAAGKPVVTTTDSGGVLEWVEDGVTGLVAAPEPRAIAAALDRLVDDPALAARLGAAARARVADLSWTPVVEALTA